MTNVKVKFRPSTVAGRPGSIIYFVTHNRIVRQITTNYRIFPNEWNERFSKIEISDDSKRAETVELIIKKVNDDLELFDTIIEKLSISKRSYLCSDVIFEFNRIKGTSYFRFMKNIISRLQKLNQIGTSKNYRAALSSFKRFRNNTDMPVGSLNSIVFEDYQAYLKSQGLALNSISFYMRIHRAVYNRAVENNLTHDCKPFRTVFTGTEKTLKRAISINDIKQIRNLDLSRRPNLEFSRDVFLFLFYCRGMSFIDAAFLKKTDIKNGVLTYRRHKTNQLLHIKIVKPIKGLIDRYTDKNSVYLLPIITPPYINERKQYETALRQVNNALKIIAKMVKLPVSLTTYVSRHAWATIAKSKNVPVNVISDALGHESIATTEIYLASIDLAVIDRVNDLIIRDL